MMTDEGEKPSMWAQVGAGVAKFGSLLTSFYNDQPFLAGVLIGGVVVQLLNLLF
jgi:hypothetical protein